MSSMGNHTIAIVHGTVIYELHHIALEDLIKEIKTLSIDQYHFKIKSFCAVISSFSFGLWRRQAHILVVGGCVSIGTSGLSAVSSRLNADIHYSKLVHTTDLFLLTYTLHCSSSLFSGQRGLLLSTFLSGFQLSSLQLALLVLSYYLYHCP